MQLKDGRVHVFAPIAPGLKQLSFAYTLPRGAFPLSVPVERATEVLEVLLQDSAGAVSGAGLREQPPVAVQGGIMRRFLAQNVPANAVARVDLPAPRASFRALFVAVVVTMVGAAMRSEEHTSELQSRQYLVCRLLLEKKKKNIK